MDNFHVYIHFPSASYLIENSQQGKDIVTEIQMIIDRADCEAGVQLYYDNVSRKTFFDDITFLETNDYLGNFGGYKLEETIDILLFETTAKNWEGTFSYNSSQPDYYVQWISSNRSVTDDFPDVLKEISKRSSLTPDLTEKSLLVNICQAYTAQNPIPIIKDNFLNASPRFIYIDFVGTFIELDTWFIQNRSKREYNFDDNRHIEEHPNYNTRKSPLLGGIAGKLNAEELLQTALGDQRAGKYLINCDESKGCYIRYESEAFNNQYHGYHLVKKQTHEVDLIEVNKIPERIILLLEYKRNLSQTTRPAE